MLKVILFFRRKPGTSREEFIHYYENNHAPLSVDKLPGILSYTRNYVVPGPAPFGHPETVPDYDVITELTFASQADYERTFAAFTDPELGKIFGEDLERFVDLSDVQRAYFVSEHVSTFPGVIGSRPGIGPAQHFHNSMWWGSLERTA